MSIHDILDSLVLESYRKMAIRSFHIDSCEKISHHSAPLIHMLLWLIISVYRLEKCNRDQGAHMTNQKYAYVTLSALVVPA